MSWYTATWVVLLIVCSVGFLATEAIALARRTPGATLSEHVWDWLRVRGSRPTVLTVAIRIALAILLIWAALHLSLGWFTLSDPVPW